MAPNFEHGQSTTGPCQNTRHTLVPHSGICQTHLWHTFSQRGEKWPGLPGNTPWTFLRSKTMYYPLLSFWTTKQSSQGKQTNRGARGSFIGFDMMNKGYMIYCLGIRRIITSEDIIFYEHLTSAIATTWQQYWRTLLVWGTTKCCQCICFLPVFAVNFNGFMMTFSHGKTASSCPHNHAHLQEICYNRVLCHLLSTMLHQILKMMPLSTCSKLYYA